MNLYGLTGGIGMGKSTAAALLEKRGVPVADTDAIARQVVEPGQPALEEVRAAFGDKVIGPDGRLRREALAEIVFADEEARRRLEAILHPRIRAAWLAQAARWRAEGCAVGVVVIPLLFETGAERDVDATLCVACTPASQRERLRARGWTDEQIDARLRAQMSAEEKMLRADIVLWSEGSVEALDQQLERALAGH